MVIAIDGPSGAGKSTVARLLARRLGFRYLDTGAMYRAVGLLALRDPATPAATLARAADIALLEGAAEGPERLLLDGVDVSAEIRAAEVAQAASLHAAEPAVREVLVAKQRALLREGDWVAEGRDIGTVVAPDAAVKVFLTADPGIRAGRRASELGVSPQAIAGELRARDERDAGRVHSPLRLADGAIELDTSELTVEQVVERLAALAHQG